MTGTRFSFKTSLGDLLNKTTEPTSTNGQVAKALKDFRETQIRDAYTRAVAKYSGDLKLPSYFGLAISSDKIIYIALDGLKTAITSIPGYENGDKVISSAEMILPKGDKYNAMVTGLEQYVSKHKIKDPSKIIENKKAMTFAVTQSYGGVGEYFQANTEAIGTLLEAVQYFGKMSDDEITDVVSKPFLQITGNGAINMAFSIFKSGARAELPKYVTTDMREKISGKRDAVAGLIEGFIKEYMEVKETELNTMYILPKQ